MRAPPAFRWWVAVLLCLATALNYLDRQALSVLAGTIQADLGLTTVQYSYVTTAFLTSYTIMYIVGGRLVDLLGTRTALALFASLWSVASGLHALARSALQFAACRLLLGAAEAANFPAGVKATAEWFPVRERALAVGIFNSGSAVGAAAAAPLISWLALTWGWRSAFLASAVAGLLWVGLWLAVYRTPPADPAAPREAGSMGAPPRVPAPRVSLAVLLRRPETWGCVLARVLTDPITYFFVFWTPLYLQRERGFDLAAIGRSSWIPFVALAFGNLAGGALPRLFVGRGWSLDRARKTVMAGASVLIAVAVLCIVHAARPALAIGLISAALFGHGTWANMTLPAEVFPRQVVATVSGFGGACGALVGALVQPLIGRTVEHLSFSPVFTVVALLPAMAWALVCVLIKNLGVERRLDSFQSDSP